MTLALRLLHWCIVFAAVGATLCRAASEVRVGRAKVVITPPVGSVIGNSYGITVATGVTSNLHAKAIVFDVGGTRAAIVACDMISLHPPIVKKARELIASRTGVPVEHVILAATHCHAGPQTHPMFYVLAGPEAQRLSEDYVARLPGMIAESVRLAEADLQPARLFVARGYEDTISFNRRYIHRDGTVSMGARGDQAIRRMGPIDPEVGVLYAEDTRGSALATLVNFPLHVAVVTGARVSADYPHTLADTLGRVKGDGMLTIFLNGMSGNINHVDGFYRGPRLSGEAEAARIGTVLAAAVLKAYRHLRPVDLSEFRASSRRVQVPVPPAPKPEEVEKARQVIAQWGKGAPFADVIRAWRTIDLAEYGTREVWESEVQAITLGRDLAIVGYPGDSFVELGLFIKQNSPYTFTFVSEQSGNGSISYVPNEKAFPERGYEVESARIAPGGGEVLATAAARLLTDLFPRPAEHADQRELRR